MCYSVLLRLVTQMGYRFQLVRVSVCVLRFTPIYFVHTTSIISAGPIETGFYPYDDQCVEL